MGSTPTSAPPVKAAQASYDAATVCAAFQATAASCANRIALRTADGATEITWREYGEHVALLAAGLASLGLSPGSTLAIQLTNRPEFHLVDMAAVHLGAVPFSVYNTSSATQIAERLANAESTIFVTEQAFLPTVLEAASQYSRLAHIIVVDGAADEAMTLDELVAAGDPEFDFEARWRAVTPDDVLTIIYTSGTTGPPKAAQLSHGNVMALLRSIDQVVPLPRENVISFMPMAHIAERDWSQYMPIAYGATTTSCPDRNAVFDVIREVQPDHLWLLPRMWQKLKEVIDGRIADMDPEPREHLRAAIAVSLQGVRLEQADEALPADLAAEVQRARALLRERFIVPFGLGRAVATGIGGAPSPRALVEWFNAIGVRVFEGYGLTETTGFGAVFSHPDHFRIGTVGRPLPGVEMRLAADGELQLRSGMNMVGYRNQPEATRAAIDEDGWLSTGDIADVDENGFVRIVDRKKDLIINSYGKNMSPVQIEGALREECPLIAQAVAVGDGRPYNIALITLEQAAAAAFAIEHGGRGAAPWQDEGITREVAAAVDRANAKLSRVEQIKAFKILPGDWAPDSEELTPTMKLRRKPIAEKYASEIEALYSP
ncbi:MAG: long-chain fatty acid--CoA ligase [Conexibacter sp.]|nr:long-chain fatty acid--CoA ligase [Conexibacter sp.]